MSKKFMLLFGVVLFAVLITVPALSQDDAHLKNKHTAEFGVGCADCHSENPPAAKVATEKCMECHGTFQEIGANTVLPDKANPHINHNEELYCDDCHHIHKRPDNYCMRCHDLEYDVP